MSVGETIGDAAAMRDALEQIRDMIMGDSFDGRSPAYIVNICDAALSTPPRNCDMPLFGDGPADNSADRAWLSFRRHNPDAYFDAPGLFRCIDWLLAPATERKGDSDGSK